ncbi:MAG: ABC transporter ATP-binding protein [Ardenticatenaceae bacterium]|nr:MAG: ABC transporter ATP-binding protein [Ardenticatenaceae bacterium]
MKLERLELNNFRQYFGQQRVKFSTDSSRHVTIIHGINGAGKTSMFMALNWCLYGKQFMGEISELMSKEALARIPSGSRAEMWVQLTFSHDGQRYILRRMMGANRRFDGEVVVHGHEEVTLRRIGADGQAIKENSPESTINAILPANVRTYFLFDGEKIDDFAKKEAAGEVKEAIRLVLRLEVLDRARTHLQSRQRVYRKELTNMTGNAELTALEAKISQAEASLQQTEERLEEIKREAALAQKKIQTIDQQLGQMEGVKELQKERKGVETAVKAHRKALEAKIEAIRATASAGYLIQAQPSIGKALAILDEKRAKGQIPSNIRQQFVNDLLESRLCICGRSIDEHSEAERKLHALLQQSVSAHLESQVVETNHQLIRLRERGQNTAAEIQRLMQERVQIIQEIESLEGQLSDLELQLKDSPQEDVRALEKTREQFLADVQNHQYEQGELGERLKTLKAQIEQLDGDIAKARKNTAVANKLERKMSLAKAGAQAIEETYKKFAADMRAQIEQRTNEIFRSLAWKAEHFDAVRLGDDYYLEVIDRYGTAARADLSAGERQVLSLSFIAAMAQVSGEEAPLVMDTPFGRLSSDHRHSITKNIPQLASQMILFVTDEELRGEARQNLEPYIGYEYQLEFDEATSCTRVIAL